MSRAALYTNKFWAGDDRGLGPKVGNGQGNGLAEIPITWVAHESESGVCSVDAPPTHTHTERERKRVL